MGNLFTYRTNTLNKEEIHTHSALIDEYLLDIVNNWKNYLLAYKLKTGHDDFPGMMNFIFVDIDDTSTQSSEMGVIYIRSYDLGLNRSADVVTIRNKDYCVLDGTLFAVNGDLANNLYMLQSPHYQTNLNTEEKTKFINAFGKDLEMKEHTFAYLAKTKTITSRLTELKDCIKSLKDNIKLVQSVLEQHLIPDIANSIIRYLNILT